MSETSEPDVTFAFELLEQQADKEKIDEATYSLRSELIEAGCSKVVRSVESAPDRSKSPEAIAVGSLVVTLAPMVLPKVFDLLKVWLKGREARSIKLKTAAGEIEVKGAMSQKEIVALLEKGLGEPKGVDGANT